RPGLALSHFRAIADVVRLLHTPPLAGSGAHVHVPTKPPAIHFPVFCAATPQLHTTLSTPACQRLALLRRQYVTSDQPILRVESWASRRRSRMALLASYDSSDSTGGTLSFFCTGLPADSSCKSSNSRREMGFSDSAVLLRILFSCHSCEPFFGFSCGSDTLESAGSSSPSKHIQVIGSGSTNILS